MYYVYENWTHKRGRGHNESCSYCNNGNGIHEIDSGNNGRWHKFTNKHDAEKKLEDIGNRGWEDVSWCARCD